MPAAPDPRHLAQRALLAWERSGGTTYAETLVSRAIRNAALPERDRPLLNALVHGVLRNRTLLDFWIASLSTRQNRRLPDDLRQLLRIALFQLLVQLASPHAAVHSCVQLARRPLRGFANALLRRADRERDQLESLALAAPWETRFSHHQFLIDRWIDHFGEASTENLLRWNNSPAINFVRFADLSFEESTGGLDQDALARGEIYVQDPSTALAPKLLAPRPGERILDACAAPGGKCLFLSALADHSAQLVATDLSPGRLATRRENLDRSPHTRSIATHQHDWAAGVHPDLGLFDAILVDAPCSNTGVLRRRVDARWRLTPESFAACAHLQTQILTHAAAHLKPGGRLVYSTCSIDPTENEAVAQAFARAHPEFEPGEPRSTLPHIDGLDGAFTIPFFKNLE
ncbi:16S rRNA (cytosine(967)-C(5))-methyltransferase RsmB [soil metagenome]